MHLYKSFQEFIAKENLCSPKDLLLLAVSGGIDSVVLCELCHQAGYNFVIAHCNFQLRDTESERDEQFVRTLGEKYGKPVLVKRFDTAPYAAQHKVSIQVAARELRYEWFFSIVDSAAAGVENQSVASEGMSAYPELQTTDYALPAVLFTAHHLDDNIETMLMNFFKGTGIAGLRGMLPKQGKIIRPLLFAKKEAIVDFAATNKLSWVEDSSNQLDKYARNYFRNQLIPLIKNLYPEAENNLADNLQRFQDIELLYQQSIEQHKKKLLECRGNEIHIPVLKLKKTPALISVVYEIIKAYGFTADQSAETIALLDSETGRYIESATHRIIKNRNWLIISPARSAEAANIIIEEGDTEIQFEAGILKMQQHVNSQHLIPISPLLAFLDAHEIKFPLLLRKWKSGDYFYPLGMRKKKKLARFFIDQKLSKTDKEKIWVLEMNKKIIWIVGHRIDDRFKITPATKQVLQIKSEALNV
ncbi:MAG: tRNA lysidine(34) synthetase TilS [Chitinophagaceae bacterium]